jgi:formylglycine-generating enzyme required for sulfatase activity/serine/threonine protein kinase
MDHLATCPSQVDLQRLFQGELPGPKVEEFARHLESCEACARTVASLPADDTLADALRQQSTAPMAPLDPALAHLMERLRALRAPTRGTAETVAPETGISTPTGAVSASSPDTSYDFLAPPQAPDEIGRLGPYRVLQVLGQGGMGMVFKAEDPRLDRLCALKTMLPEIARKPAMKERFLREAKAAAKIEHDHIIPIYQVDEAGGVPYISMPFLKGASLEDYLKQKEKGRAGAALTMPQIIKIAREIARGLAAAHERGMIHRDIKPANIWLDGSAGGRVKILDFGLARLSQATGEQNLTQSGAIMGTPSYMAPEQAQAQKLDGRADLFSLGVILYRLCTGELPFKGHDPISTLMALAMHNPPPPSQINPAIPPALSDLVMRLLAKDPEQRTASANDVLRELQAVGAALSAGEGTSSPVSSASITPGVEAIQIDQSADSRMSTSPYAPSSLSARLRQARPFFRRPAGIATIAAGLLAMIVLGTVYWIQTRAGVIRVEITDPEIEVAIKGTTFTFTGADPLPVSVKPGEGDKVFVVTRGDFTFETDRLFLKKGDDTTVKVELLDGVVQVTADGESIGAKALVAPQVVVDSPPSEYSWPVDAPPPAIAPFDAAQAEAHQEAWAAHLGVPVEYTNSIGMKFRLIPPGEFMMGSTAEEIEQAKVMGELYHNHESWIAKVDAEGPRHRVQLTQPFYLGSTEVTVGQFRRFVEATAYVTIPETDGLGGTHGNAKPIMNKDWTWKAPGFNQSEAHPVCQITSADAQAFNRWLTETDGCPAAFPNEAQWEFACRAGTTTFWNWGDNRNDAEPHAWYKMTDKASSPRAVALGMPNAFGLYDMHGNVREWCADRYDNQWYAKSPTVDPVAPIPRAFRVARGGAYDFNLDLLRSAFRYRDPPDQRGDFLGFRVALSLDAVRQAIKRRPAKDALDVPDYALDFDGQSNWVHIPTLSTDGTHPLTVECWIWPRRFEGNQPAIKMAGPGSLGLHIGQDHIVANCFQGRSAHGVRMPAADNRDRWSHVACVWDGAEFRLYLDGRRCGEVYPTKAKPHEPRMTMLGGCPPELQVLTAEADFFDGMLNEVRFSRVARYAEDFTPEKRFTPDADTLALYHCDEGAGETLSDSSGHGHHGKVMGTKWVRPGAPSAISAADYDWPSDAPPPAIAPFDAAQAKAHQEAWARHLGVPVEYTNSIGMKFRLIPPGEFMMGSTPDEIEEALVDVGTEDWKAHIRSEAPRYKVILSRPIYLGVHEVTQSQYEQVMGQNPSHFAATGAGKDAVAGLDTTSHPVEMVSWNDAAEFCAKLSEQEKLKPVYFRTGETVTMRATGNGYRLPTEAQWEFACRAGTTTNYWTGSQGESLVEVAWFGRNSGGRTQRVEGLKSNPFGLHDIHGNVWEWVQDVWEPTYYGQFASGHALNPTGPSTAGPLRVLRGGGWGSNAVVCRSAHRNNAAPTTRTSYPGFRVALEVDAVQHAVNGNAVSGGRQPDGPETAADDAGPTDAPPSAIAHALLFDDRTDAVDLSAVTFDGSHDLTIEGWFKSLEFVHCEFARFEPDGPVLFAMPKGEKGEIGAQWKDQDGRDVYAVCIDALRVGQPQHIALVYRRQRMLVFVDGTPIAESEVPTRPGAMKRLQLMNTLMELHGLRVSRVSRYTIPFQPEDRFTADEQTIALFHCDEGEGDVLTDSSGNGFHGRITGAKWVPRPPSASPDQEP